MGSLENQEVRIHDRLQKTSRKVGQMWLYKCVLMSLLHFRNKSVEPMKLVLHSQQNKDRPFSFSEAGLRSRQGQPSTNERRCLSRGPFSCYYLLKCKRWRKQLTRIAQTFAYQSICDSMCYTSHNQPWPGTRMSMNHVCWCLFFSSFDP